jgi:hypothetical protein
MDKAKNYTLRLDSPLAAALEMAARVEDMSIAEWLRRSVSQSLDEKSNDPDFRDRVRGVQREDQEVLDHLLGRARVARSESDTPPAGSAAQD